MRASYSGLPRTIRGINVRSGRAGLSIRDALTVDGWFLIAFVAAVGIALAFLLAHISILTVIGVALLPAAAWLLSRSYGGLVLGLFLMLTLPYWHTVGVAHFTLLRLAAIAAAATLLVNHRIRLHRLDLALLVFVLLLVGDWFLRYRQPGAGSALVAELTPVGFYLGARALPPGRMRSVALIVVLAGALGGLTVIYEYVRGYAIFHNPTSYDWNATDNSIFRPGGVFGSPPAASSVMCCVILFGIACIATYRGKLRAISGVCTAIASLALILTFTRAGLIAAGAGIILLLWLIRSQLLRPLRVAWFVAVLAGLYFLLVPGLGGNTTFQRGFIRPGTLAARESYWGVALPVSTSSVPTFVFGSGTGILEAPQTAPTVVVSAKIAESPQLTENSLHSQYITTLVEQGALGVAALVFLLVAGFLRPARIARATRDPIVAATATSIFSIAVMMSVGTVSLVPPAFAMLMLAIGFAGALSQDWRTLAVLRAGG